MAIVPRTVICHADVQGWRHAAMIYLHAYAATAAGYGLLALFLLVVAWKRPRILGFAGVVALHGLWAASMRLQPDGAIAAILLTAHLAAWSIFFSGMFPGGRSGLRLAVLVLAPLPVAGKLALFLFGDVLPGAAIQAFSLADLAATVMTFLLAVAVFQAARESERWSLKFLCLPIGALMAYEMFLFALGLTTGPGSSGFLAARGPLELAVMPLVALGAIRTRPWRFDFRVSRQAAIYSITLIGVGLYLMLAAGAAMLLRRFPAADAVPLQVGLLFAALLLLGFLLSSGGMRARLRLFLVRHFFARKYDHAHEWRKLMATLAHEAGEAPLENRVIRACANVLDVPGGALWHVDRPGGQPHLQALWNRKPPADTPGAEDVALLCDDGGNPRCLHGDALTAGVWGRDPEAWLVLPLPHETGIVGFIVLSRPRARQTVDGEDEELLLLVARQCASFMAESRALAALEENRQFDRFYRQYAFVAHDIKNIISQLSVMLRNFDRHADNPEFRSDMRDTIGNTVTRMENLVERLSRLGSGDAGGEASEPIALAEFLAAESTRLGMPGIVDTGPDASDMVIRVPSERFSAILGHLLANAREAGGPEGRVRIRLGRAGRHAAIDIVDDGPGMSEEFIREELFMPFRSTKRGGFGVGAYQCREFAREQGGDLEVVSSPGSGTTMRLRLPLARQEAEPA